MLGLVKMPKWKQSRGLIDSSYLGNYILWDTWDLSGLFNLSTTSKQALLGRNQGTDQAKCTRLPFMALNTYCFLLSQENNLWYLNLDLQEKKKNCMRRKKKLSKFKYWFIRKNNKSKKKSMWSYVASTHDSN